MNSLEGFDETSLPDKKAFYSVLYLKNVPEEDYIHAQNIFKEFEIKKLGEYHDIYVQSDTLLIADVFESFRNKCIKTYELDSAHFFICTWISMTSLFKICRLKLELLTNNNMLIMVEKGMKGAIYHAIHRYAKGSNKYIKKLQ